MESNRINTYTCPDGHVTVTRDLDQGVTPMFMSCSTCDQRTRSAFYQVDQSLEPTHEWYMPAHPHRYKDPSMRQHVEAGGLAFRKIGDPDETDAMPEPVPPTVHELKTLPQFFDDIVIGNKAFEVRKNDRAFKVEDQLHLLEYDPESGYTGRSQLVDVFYVLPGGQHGIAPDYCVMSIALHYDVNDIFGDDTEPF